MPADPNDKDSRQQPDGEQRAPGYRFTAGKAVIAVLPSATSFACSDGDATPALARISAYQASSAALWRRAAACAGCPGRSASSITSRVESSSAPSRQMDQCAKELRCPFDSR